MPSNLPYGRQSVNEDDIRAVVDVLRSDWLTTGPAVEAFERAVADTAGVQHAVAVCNGTAALHTAAHALGIGPGDEVIVPPLTFAATANAVVYCGATPIFADVDPETLLLDPESVRERITPRTRAVFAVDYAGQPCDYDRLRAITTRHGLKLLADGCHALGAYDQGRPVGSLADVTVFSFHPVKPITTGEGGMITTDDVHLAERMRRFRNHGITTDFRAREKSGSWHYDIVELGCNYRLTDIQSALGLSQLRRLDAWTRRRCELARRYDAALGDFAGVTPLVTRAGVAHAYHLYVVQLDAECLGVSRRTVFTRLRAAGVGVNVHYIPVHLHPLYRERLNTRPGLCPVAEAAYERILSLPLFAGMSDADVDRVVGALEQAVRVRKEAAWLTPTCTS